MRKAQLKVVEGGRKRGRPRINPRTREEWQDAVTLAHAMVLLDAMQQYGLADGGPKAAIDRCRRVLRDGARKGYRPDEKRALEALAALREE